MPHAQAFYSGKTTAQKKALSNKISWLNEEVSLERVLLQERVRLSIWESFPDEAFPFRLISKRKHLSHQLCYRLKIHEVTHLMTVIIISVVLTQHKSSTDACPKICIYRTPSGTSHRSSFAITTKAQGLVSLNIETSELSTELFICYIEQRSHCDFFLIVFLKCIQQYKISPFQGTVWWQLYIDAFRLLFPAVSEIEIPKRQFENWIFWRAHDQSTRPCWEQFAVLSQISTHSRSEVTETSKYWLGEKLLCSFLHSTHS